MRKISSLSTEIPTVDYPKIKPEAPRISRKNPQHSASVVSVAAEKHLITGLSRLVCYNEDHADQGPRVSYFYQPIIRTGIWLSAKLS